MIPPMRDLFTRNRYFLLRLAKWRTLTDLFMNCADRFGTDANFYHMHLIDAVSHWLWNDFDQKDRPDSDNQALLGAYINTDRMVGRIVSRLSDPSTLLVIVSDHGFTADRRLVGGWRVNGDGLVDAVDKQPGCGSNVERKTRWHRHEAGAIMVTVSDSLAQQEFEAFVAGITDGTTGCKVFETERVGSNHLVIKPRSDGSEHTTVLSGGMPIPRGLVLRREERQQTGYHSRQGSLILIAGPNVRKGVQIQAFAMFDIVPTILTLMGIPIPIGLDGECVLEAIEPEYLEKCPICYSDPQGTVEAVSADGDLNAQECEVLTERLRGLGYL